MVPAVGSTSLVRLLKVVDFPAPFTPKRAKHSPDSRPKEMFSTATRVFGLQQFFEREYTLRRFYTFILNCSFGVEATLSASYTTSGSSLMSLSNFGKVSFMQHYQHFLRRLPRSVSIM